MSKNFSFVKFSCAFVIPVLAFLSISQAHADSEFETDLTIDIGEIPTMPEPPIEIVGVIPEQTLTITPESGVVLSPSAGESHTSEKSGISFVTAVLTSLTGSKDLLSGIGKTNEVLVNISGSSDHTRAKAVKIEKVKTITVRETKKAGESSVGHVTSSEPSDIPPTDTSGNAEEETYDLVLISEPVSEPAMDIIHLPSETFVTDPTIDIYFPASTSGSTHKADNITAVGKGVTTGKSVTYNQNSPKNALQTDKLSDKSDSSFGRNKNLSNASKNSKDGRTNLSKSAVKTKNAGSKQARNGKKSKYTVNEEFVSDEASGNDYRKQHGMSVQNLVSQNIYIGKIDDALSLAGSEPRISFAEISPSSGNDGSADIEYGMEFLSKR